MITPRQTRLIRVHGLRAFQRAIRVTSSHSDISRLRDCVVIVPSGAAADQLRRTFEDEAFAVSAVRSPLPADRAICLPRIVTRAGWYDELHARLESPPSRLTALEREVLLGAAARDAATRQQALPYRLRAGLLVEMLSFYDELRRRNVPVDRFELLMTEELQQDAASDRGAERLLLQTRFLAAAFRGYEARLSAAGAVDEHALRPQLLTAQPRRPLRQIVVTVGDRTGDPDGLWKVDFDLLTRLPLLARIDVIATEASLAAGFHERIHDLLPGLEEIDEIEEAELASPEDEGRRRELSEPPALGAPSGTGPSVYSSRDREEELADIAERIKRSPHTAPLDRTAIVFRRPLPYVYLARGVFADAGIPHQTLEALPLAAEPYAAALDLVFDFVTSEFTRQAVTALLASPHFTFEVDGQGVTRLDIAALDRALSQASYLGGYDRLQSFAQAAASQEIAGPEISRIARAARAASSVARELLALFSGEAPSTQIAALLDFLETHDRMPAPDDSLKERYMRARAAIHAAIHALRRAHQRFDEEPRSFSDVAAMIRRWIEGQTFAPRAGSTGVQLLEAQAARYGDFDQVHLVGFVDGEWPQRSARSIFYPHALLMRFGWPDAKALSGAERASFEDLLRLARRRVELSTFTLENDSIIGPSVFLEDVDQLGLPIARDAARPVGRVFGHQALIEEPVVPAVVSGEAADWLRLRLERTDAADAAFHGRVDPRQERAYAVGALETYLQCPFRFFAERVLKLEEELEDEPARTPRARGKFVHEVFRAFFHRWDARGHRAITPENLAEARSIFADVLDPLLAPLPDGDATVERARLLGSAVDEGLAEAVFRLEAEWETPVSTRLLEYRLKGPFEITDGSGSRMLPLSGIADRIDLLEDGTFRLIDYKLGRAPDRAVALQVPIYSICAAQQLQATTGRRWEPGEAGYVAFAERRRFLPMLGRGADRETTLRDAQARLLRAVDGIARGEFPPRPYEVSLCLRCPQAAVCRKDYVGDV